MRKASIKQAFWDYDFTERQLLKKLEEGTKQEKAWIVGRIMENLPFESIWRYVTLNQVRDLFPHINLRPQLKKIWRYTFSLWDKYEKASH